LSRLGPTSEKVGKFWLYTPIVRFHGPNSYSVRHTIFLNFKEQFPLFEHSTEVKPSKMGTSLLHTRPSSYDTPSIWASSALVSPHAIVIPSEEGIQILGAIFWIPAFARKTTGG
jgi:hypothetical protein